MVQNQIERLITYTRRSLTIVYRDYNSSFNYLLKYKSVCIHHKNICLAVELFKVKQNLSNVIMSEIFPTRVLNYNLRSQTDFFSIPSIPQNVVTSYFASKVCSMIPAEIKNSMTNPFVASVLILVITDPKYTFTCKLEVCCKYFQMW